MSDSDTMSDSDQSAPIQSADLALDFNVTRPPLVDPSAIVADQAIPGGGLNSDDIQPPPTKILQTELLTINGVPCVVEYWNIDDVNDVLGNDALIPVIVHSYWSPGSDLCSLASKLMADLFEKDPAVYASNWLGAISDEHAEVISGFCEQTGFVYDGKPAMFAWSEYEDQNVDIPVMGFPQILEYLGVEPFPPGGYWTNMVVQVPVTKADDYFAYIEENLYDMVVDIVNEVRATSAATLAEMKTKS